MNFRYVEARRIQVARVLSPADLQHVTVGNVLLSQIRDHHFVSYAGGQTRLKPDLDVLGPGKLAYDKWPLEFPNDAACEVTVDTDPADAYGSEAIFITLNKSAVSAIAHALAPSADDDASALIRYWNLSSIRLRWLTDCPLVDVVSVFDIADEQLRPAELDRASTACIAYIDPLWPLLFAITQHIAPMPSRAGEVEAHSTSLAWPFAQPRSFRRLGREKPDPSWDYQYDAILIARSAGPQMSAILEALNIVSPPIHSKGRQLFVSDRAWSVHRVDLVETSAAESLDEDVRAVLGTTLLGMVTQFETLIQTLYAALLIELSRPNHPFNGDILRRLAYRTESMRLVLRQRALLLSDANRKVFDKWAQTYALHDEAGRTDRLAGFILNAAEGHDADRLRSFEQFVQMISVFFFCIVVLSFLLDAYNFTHGTPSQQAEVLRKYRFEFTIVTTVTSVLAFALFTIRLARQQSRRASGT